MESFCARQEDRQGAVGAVGVPGSAQDQAASKVVAGLAHARYRWQSGGRVFRIGRAGGVFDRGETPVEEGPRFTKCGMVLRSGFGVGRGEFSGDLDRKSTRLNS